MSGGLAGQSCQNWGLMPTNRRPASLLCALLALSLTTLVATEEARAYGPQSGSQVIEAYFAALDRENYPEALRYTVGQAHALTSDLVGELHRRSADRHVRVELATRRVAIAPPIEGAIQVSFDIDVLGRWAFFRKVVRSIHGQASFVVDDYGRIVSIAGDLGL